MSGLQNLPAGVEIQLRAVEPGSDAHHPITAQSHILSKRKRLALSPEEEHMH